jgi:hypothetical protein
MNGVIATLDFILHNSVMFQVQEGQLNKELVDLGLPKGINQARSRKCLKHNKDFQE